MDDAQTWTLIAGFFGLVATMIVLTLRAVRGEIGSRGAELRGEIASSSTELHGEIGTLRAEMNGRFDTVDAQLSHLDRDVQGVVNRLMGP